MGQGVIGMVFYCSVVWERVIDMVFVLCVGVAACNMYGLCTVWCCAACHG